MPISSVSSEFSDYSSELEENSFLHTVLKTIIILGLIVAAIALSSLLFPSAFISGFLFIANILPFMAETIGGICGFIIMNAEAIMILSLVTTLFSGITKLLINEEPGSEADVLRFYPRDTHVHLDGSSFRQRDGFSHNARFVRRSDRIPSPVYTDPCLNASQTRDVGQTVPAASLSDSKPQPILLPNINSFYDSRQTETIVARSIPNAEVPPQQGRPLYPAEAQITASQSSPRAFGRPPVAVVHDGSRFSPAPAPAQALTHITSAPSRPAAQSRSETVEGRFSRGFARQAAARENRATMAIEIAHRQESTLAAANGGACASGGGFADGLARAVGKQK